MMTSELANWIAIIFAPSMIIVGLFLAYRKATPSNISVSVVFFGLVLLVFDVMRPTDFTINRTGVSMKTGVSEIKASETIDVANMQPSIDKTNKALEIINKALSEQDKRINTLTAAAQTQNPKLAEVTQLKTPAIPTIQLPVIPPGKTVLVFYKNNQKIANDIVAALRGKGFRSAASNSSLNEISQWIVDKETNNITIAANGTNDALLQVLNKIVLDATGEPTDKVHTTDDWSFKAADAQIYIF